MSSSNSPCAACKCLRRKCTQECVFAPYFPPDQPQRFSNVHKVFGASNVAKLLNELNPSQREDAVNSLAYEAEARLRDPVYGCVGLISILQHRLKQLQGDLFTAKKELATYIGPSAMMPLYQPNFAGVHPPSAAPATAAGVVPYGASPMVGPGVVAGGVGPGRGQLVIQEAAAQPALQQHQLMEAQQQLAAAMAAREDLEMLRNWEQPQSQPQPQPQQFLRFNGCGSGGGYEAAVAVVGGGGGGGGFNQIVAPAAVGSSSPSLALGGATFDHHHHNPYHHQQQQQHQHHHDHHEAHQIQQQDDHEGQQDQEPLLLLQQAETLEDNHHGGHVEKEVVAQAIPLQPQQLQPSTSIHGHGTHHQHHHHLDLYHHHHHHQHQHDHHQHSHQQQQVQRSGNEEGRSTVGPSC